MDLRTEIVWSLNWIISGFNKYPEIDIKNQSTKVERVNLSIYRTLKVNKSKGKKP